MSIFHGYSYSMNNARGFGKKIIIISECRCSTNGTRMRCSSSGRRWLTPWGTATLTRTLGMNDPELSAISAMFYWLWWRVGKSATEGVRALTGPFLLACGNSPGWTTSWCVTRRPGCPFGSWWLRRQMVLSSSTSRWWRRPSGNHTDNR